MPSPAPSSRLSRFLPEWAVAETGALLALLGAAVSLLLFALLADAVIEGTEPAFDEAVLHAFRHADNPAIPLGPDKLRISIVDLTALGSTTVLLLITLIVAGFLALDKNRATALFVLGAVLSGNVLGYVLKHIFERPRPDVVPHLVDVGTASFPSGHAMGAAVTYLTLGVLVARTLKVRRLKIYVLTISIGLTLLIGISRLYLGVHWPTDVLAGWCAGSAWALICWLFALLLQRTGGAAIGENDASRAR